jgi:hypothetical protein
VSRRPLSFRIADPEGPPTLDAAGRARSVQAAELALRPETFDAIWSVAGLDRLGRAYWRFLTRITLGLIRVVRTPDADLVVLLIRPAVLLAFGPPDYVLDADHGLITWQIRGGLLSVGNPDPPASTTTTTTTTATTTTAAAANGALRIELRRLERTRLGGCAVRVEISVVGFRPMIARRFGPTAYARTQALVHVFVTHSFMRSLTRTRLASLEIPAEPLPADDSPTPG